MAAHGGTTLRMSRVDRLWRASTTVTSIGPIEVPDRARIVDAFVAYASCGPSARVGLRFDPASHRSWTYRTDDLHEYARGCVVQLRPGADDDLDDLLARVADQSPDRPIRVFLADRHLITVVSHAIGDSRFVLSLPAALLGWCSTGELDAWTRTDTDPNPLRSALRTTFDSRESLATLLRARRRLHAARAALAVDTGATREFVPRPVVVNESGATNATRELKTWMRAHQPAAGHFAVVVTMVHQALREHGIASTPELHMVYDLRRYLPKGHRTLGNFVAGINLPVHLQDPTAITSAVNDAAKTGHPLAAATLGVVLAGGRRPGRAPQLRVARNPRAELALSYVGVKPVDNGLPWTDTIEHRTFWSRVDPAGPAGITLLVAVIGRRLRLSANFHATVFDPQTVRAALRAAQDDQIGLLTRALAATPPGPPPGSPR